METLFQKIMNKLWKMGYRPPLKGVDWEKSDKSKSRKTHKAGRLARKESLSKSVLPHAIEGDPFDKYDPHAIEGDPFDKFDPHAYLNIPSELIIKIMNHPMFDLIMKNMIKDVVQEAIHNEDITIGWTDIGR